MRYLALGDSYTIGADVLPDQRWPNQLVDMLRAKGVEISNPTIIAQIGWTTRDLLKIINEADFTDSFNLVSLLIGVNNQYQGLSLQAYRQEFRSLLLHAARFAGGSPAAVLVLSIPDWGMTPFATGRDRAQIRTEIDAFNSENYEETQRLGARYVDITQVSRRAGSEESLLAEDGLHPSGIMYADWALSVYPAAFEILQPEGN
jgi:lysophospholipase L1-like esterase